MCELENSVGCVGCRIPPQKRSMKYAFIGGIPRAGKSELAEKVARATGAVHIDIDEWREEMGKDPNLEPWVNFFWNKNEGEYWKIVNCEEHWENLKKQSEALWPAIIRRANEIIKSGKPAIFEGVNILPHLTAKDFNFPGIFLLGESLEVIFERNKKDPRWGQTETLQKKEAEMFFFCERPRYEREAKKYGFKTFTDPNEAEKELTRLLETSFRYRVKISE